LRRFLASARIGYGRRAVRVLLASPSRGDGYGAIVSVSLPVLSDDGRRALVAFSHSGAGASLQLLERQADGSWSLSAYQPLAVY
jgi:hypothetical protein